MSSLLQRRSLFKLQNTNKHALPDIIYLKSEIQDYECQCIVCKSQYDRKIEILKSRTRDNCSQIFQKSLIKKQEKQNSYTFVLDLLSSLQNHKNRSFGICIPDTIIFENAMPKAIMTTQFNQNQKIESIKSFKQKQKLTFFQIRKFLDENHKKYINQIRMRAFQLSNGALSATSFISTQKRDKNVKKIHQGTLSRDSRNSNYFSVGSKNNDEHRFKKEKQFGIVNYMDNNTQLLNQVEFKNLLNKRKIDPIWFNISSLQNIVKSKGNYTYKLFRFKNCDIIDLQLYNRAKKEVMVFIDENQKNQYIPVQEQELLKDQLKLDQYEYIKYITYKLVHYLKIVEGVNIYHFDLYFMRDMFDNFYLMNAKNIYYSREQKIWEKQKHIEYNNHQLLQKKKVYKAEQITIFHKISINMLANALQKRNIELKMGLFERPSNEVLQKIFNKFHPNFFSEVDKIMDSNNWKSLIEDHIKQIRQKNKSLIESDEGIKILNRFGIFYTKSILGINKQKSVIQERAMPKISSSTVFKGSFKVHKKSNDN